MTMSARRSGMLLLALGSLRLFAQDGPGSGLVGNASASVGVHSQGFMLNVVRTGTSRFGFFVGYAGTARKDSDLPTEADFTWVNYANEDWKSKDAYHAGIAFRVNPKFQFGVGFGGKSTEYYKWGYGVTGLTFRKTATRSKTENGGVVMLDFGQARGWGLHVVAGTSGVGVGVAGRF